MASSENASATPSLPWTVRVQLTALGALHRRDGSVRRLLFSLGDLHAAARPKPDASGVRSADVTIDASTGLWARVFSPASAAAAAEYPLPVVVYFHGGGFVLFSAASRPYDALCRRLCSALGAVVVSVNYRLASRHRFPAAYDDGVAALHYLAANGLPAGAVDLSSCFLAGDSAGGNIVHHVAQRWASTSAPPGTSVRIAGAVMIQPFFGGEERTGAEVALDRATPSLSMAATDHYWREFLPEGTTRDHAAARVCGDGVALPEAFPPAMVVVGGFDLLKDWQARYVEALRAKAKKQVRVVEYPAAIHGFYAFPELADSGKLMEEVKLFVEEHRSKPAF